MKAASLLLVLSKLRVFKTSATSGYSSAAG
jgi:hypothetical protein